MPGIRMRDGDAIEGALKRLRKQCEKAGVLGDLKKRECYEKPSVRLKRKAESARKRMLKKIRKFGSA